MPEDPLMTEAPAMPEQAVPEQPVGGMGEITEGLQGLLSAIQAGTIASKEEAAAALHALAASLESQPDMGGLGGEQPPIV